MRSAALFAARMLIGALLVAGALQKAVDPAPASALLALQGLPGALVWPALVYDALAGALLWAGFAVRPVTVSAAFYCGVTSLFHLALFLEAGDPWQVTIFVKNWAIAGGCLALAVAGWGRWAVRPDV